MTQDYLAAIGAAHWQVFASVLFFILYLGCLVRSVLTSKKNYIHMQELPFHDDK